MACQTPYRGDTSQMLLFKIASCLAEGSGGVLSFNGQTGAVTFTGADIITLLGFTPISQADGDSRYVLKAGDTMTGALVHPDGTAALPSITFTGDLDTGIYRIGANSFGSSAGGSVILETSTTGINLTDALAYRYNSVNVIRAQTGLGNFFFGPSGNLTMTGISNTSVGHFSFISNTTGDRIVAVGTQALRFNTTGDENTAVGNNGLLSNTTGSGNSAVGNMALNSNTVGDNNTAFGSSALSANISGVENSAFGFASLFNNTTGSSNLGIGRSTLLVNTTGSSNTAVGFGSLITLTTGSLNTAIGSGTGGGTQMLLKSG